MRRVSYLATPRVEHWKPPTDQVKDILHVGSGSTHATDRNTGHGESETDIIHSYLY